MSHNGKDTPVQLAVRAMMVIDSFDKILSFIGHDITVIPLKGIDLLESLYAETLDREVNDIDLLVPVPGEFTTALERLMAHGFTPEFKFALDADALARKRKVSLKSPSPALPDVDLHMTAITKKFFSASTETFNSDIVKRSAPCPQRKGVRRLDTVDKWLFLAQHLAFHMFNGKKWVKDLWLLQRDMSPAEISTLISRAHVYGMTRIVAATRYHLWRHFNNRGGIHIPDIETDNGFIDFIRRNARQFNHRSNRDRFIAGFWEMAFIDDPRKRRKAYLRLIFPYLGTMKNIYRTRNRILTSALYAVHVPLMSVGTAIFLYMSK